LTRQTRPWTAAAAAAWHAPNNRIGITFTIMDYQALAAHIGGDARRI
jgi:hypothetical protein